MGVKKEFGDINTPMRLFISKSVREKNELHSKVLRFIKDLEQFEADWIMCEEVWNTEDGLPKFTQEFYDRWIELQSRRNELLGCNLGKARTYNELMK